MTVAINLSELPAPDILTTLNFEVVLSNYKAKLIEFYPACADVLELESEPLVKLLQLAAYREMLLTARYNDEARALLLAYATGTDLDHIGFTYYRGELRLVITVADDDAIPPVLEVLESDDDFRNRLALKIESYSTAGPTDAYNFHALSASGLVKDSSCTSPQAGTSLITVLSRIGSGVPDAALLDIVRDKLSIQTIRPQCEEVIVQAATVHEYELIATLYTYAGPDNSLVLTAAEQELIKYTEQHHRLGHDHTVTGLVAAAHRPGVQKVTLNITEDLVASKLEANYCTSITVLFGGVAE